MVRTLSPSLAAAVKASGQAPTFSLSAQDLAVRFSLLATAGTAGRSDALLTPAGSILRVTCTQNTADPQSILLSRIPNPGTASQWTATPTTLATDAAAKAGCAIGISGTTIRVFWQKSSDSKLYYSQSTNDGLSWSAETPTNSATPYSFGNFVYGIASPDATTLLIAWAVYDDPTQAACSIDASTLSGSTWSPWSNTGPTSPPYGRVKGLSGTLGPSSSVFTGAFQLFPGLSGPAVSTFTLTTGTYSPLTVVRSQDNPNLGLSLSNPTIHYDPVASLYYLTIPTHDDGTISGTPSYRHDLLTSPNLSTWSVFASFAQLFQFNAQFLSVSGTIYAFDGTSVYSHSGPASPTDLSNDVLSLEVTDLPDKASVATIVLDNSQSQYNGLGAPRIDTTLTLATGYGAETVQTHTLLLEAYEYSASPYVASLTLHAKSLDKRLDYQAPRTNAFTSFTIAQLITQLAATAQLTLATLPTTPQFSQAVPCFLLTAGETYRTALDRLSRIYGFTFHANTSGILTITEYAHSDPHTWDYGPELLATTYAISADQPNHIRVIGYNATTNNTAPTYADVYDIPNILAVGQERYAHFVDRMLDTSAKCAITAALALYAAQRDVTTSGLSAAMNPAHELGDVITLTDPTLALVAIPLRIDSIKTTIHPEHGIWLTQLTCTGA